MWTNEFTEEGSLTTLLDDSALHEDVIVEVHEDGSVTIEQWTVSEESVDSSYNLIELTPHMFSELLNAMHCTAGAYRLKNIDGN